MNQMLSTVEFERDVATPMPAVMTRREKLLRFAQIVRERPLQAVFIFSGLEHRQMHEWDAMEHPCSAFAIAAADPVLSGAGLSSATVGAAAKFFDLSRDDVHAFSCDCGGGINNEDMARRIEGIANR